MCVLSAWAEFDSAMNQTESESPEFDSAILLRVPESFRGTILVFYYRVQLHIDMMYCTVIIKLAQHKIDISLWLQM